VTGLHAFIVVEVKGIWKVEETTFVKPSITNIVFLWVVKSRFGSAFHRDCSHRNCDGMQQHRFKKSLACQWCITMTRYGRTFDHDCSSENSKCDAEMPMPTP
jgi:hypothetical protein